MTLNDYRQDDPMTSLREWRATHPDQYDAPDASDHARSLGCSAPLPEEADAERDSRMTAAQLRDRIHEMEASEAAGKGKPGQRTARREKLTKYRAELARKEAADATAQAAAEADRAEALARPEAIGPLRIGCPTCYANIAENCTNYHDQKCATHGSRKDAWKRLGGDPPAPTPQPEPTAAPAPTTLRATLKSLIREHGLPSVLDDAWEAAHDLDKERRK